MNARSLTLVLAIAVGAVAGGVAGALLAPRAPQARPAGEGDGVGALQASVARLGERQNELARSVERLQASVAARPASSTRVSVDEVGAAVERYLAQREPEPDALAAEAAALRAHGNGGDQGAAYHADHPEVLAAVEALLAADLSDDDTQALWRAYSKKGMADALIAAFEQRAEREPNNPDRKVELGHAYLQKIFEVGNSPEAGKWATKADKAFDAALALDDHNWDARFSKAVSLSFWPPLFGKQGEAIAHFETLVEQQAGMPKQKDFAQTHLLLGNMHQQMGSQQKAIAAWQAGLAQFPDNQELLKQLQLAQGQ